MGARVESTREKDGIAGEAISWSVGYGPRTEAWLLRPASATGALPGVVALHDHSAFELLGKEKIADTVPTAPTLASANFAAPCRSGGHGS